MLSPTLKSMACSEAVLHLYSADGAADKALLIRSAAAAFCPEAYNRLSIERSGRGKPYFPDAPEVCFSVSHSGELYGVAVCGSPVGLDIQRRVSHGDIRRVAGRFFHPAEQGFVERYGVERFFDVWAAKESYVKYTGMGIDESFCGFSTVDGDTFPGSVEGAELRLVDAGEEYAACVCAYGLDAVRVIDHRQTK